MGTHWILSDVQGNTVMMPELAANGQGYWIVQHDTSQVTQGADASSYDIATLLYGEFEVEAPAEEAMELIAIYV